MNAVAQPLRIAMWSGPRNVSTAMMRAWENRSDTVVCDEPFYAHYLQETGLEHPGKAEIIAAGETDWRRVVSQLTGPVPGGQKIFYQKHMTHHLLPHISRDWLGEMVNCFLIRDPREVLLSYLKTRDHVTVEDIGVPQQAEIFDYVRHTLHQNPVVIDAELFLKNLRAQLCAWCESLGIAFTEAMLHWPSGPRDDDGIWAPYWYDAVIASTGFAPYRPRTGSVPKRYHGILEVCEPIYETLREHRLTV